MSKPSSKPLRALIVEDSEDDAELMSRSLRQAGYDLVSRRVETPGALEAALREEPSWPIVLSDFRMPSFNAFDALAVLQRTGQDAAFVVVSGAIGEETAVQLMRRGAHDYLSKDHLGRLAAIVERELHDLENRRAKRAAEAALRESARRDGLLSRVSQALAESLDYERTLARFAELVLRENLVDWCVIDAVGEEGAGAQRIVASRDFGEPPLARPLPAGGLPEKVGRTFWQARIDPGALREAGSDPRVRREIERWGMESTMSVPLRSRDKLLGVVTGVRGRGRAPFMEESLRFAQQLCDRAALAIDNARLYGEAMRAVSLRENVLAIVSHDLRNPLSSIALASQVQLRLLRQPPAELRDRRIEKNAELVLRAARQMERLILDLLDLARIRGQRLQLELGPSSARALLQEVRELFQPVAAEKGVRLEIDPPGGAPGGPSCPDCEIVCDRGRMVQVFSNLVGNSVKFTPAGGSVWLRLLSCEEGRVRFAVQDTGPGIRESDIPHIFERFWQARSQPQQKGIGLGLSIARGVIDAHEGRIWVESRLGAGSTFFVEIPARPVRGQAA